MAAVVVIRKLQEDEAEHRDGILAGFQVGVGAQIVGGTPEIGFELLELVASHGSPYDLELA